MSNDWKTPLAAIRNKLPTQESSNSQAPPFKQPADKPLPTLSTRPSTPRRDELDDQFKSSEEKILAALLKEKAEAEAQVRKLATEREAMKQEIATAKSLRAKIENDLRESKQSNADLTRNVDQLTATGRTVDLREIAVSEKERALQEDEMRLKSEATRLAAQAATLAPRRELDKDNRTLRSENKRLTNKNEELREVDKEQQDKLEKNKIEKKKLRTQLHSANGEVGRLSSNNENLASKLTRT